MSIQNIKLSDIKAHPNNPRRELGDLTELAASIKEQGILQNITVVKNSDGTYTSIIGHRRLAAAKLAGLTQAPCTIANMDEATQASVMLLENMQRSDLTIYEQAQGFQMCLDLGITEDELSKKTGLSKKTVKHRVKMLELDQDKVKEKCKDATIFDFVQLEKIKDIKLRNKVLENLGTNNFNYSLQAAIKQEKYEKLFKIIIPVLEQFATKLKKRPSYETHTSVTSWGAWTEESKFKNYEIPTDKRTYQYFYNAASSDLTLYYKKKEMESNEPPVKSKWEIEREEREKRNDKVRELGKTLFQLRIEFIKNIESIMIASPKFDKILKYYTGIILTANYVDSVAENDDYIEGVELDNNLFYGLIKYEPDEIDLNDVKKQLDVTLNKTLLYIIYATLETREDISCIDYNGVYDKDFWLELLYEFLQEMGYEISDIEKQILDGTHPIYTKE